MAMYYWDEESGDHVVTDDGVELRFPTRTAALRAVHDLVESATARRDHPAQRARRAG